MFLIPSVRGQTISLERRVRFVVKDQILLTSIDWALAQVTSDFVLYICVVRHKLGDFKPCSNKRRSISD